MRTLGVKLILAVVVVVLSTAMAQKKVNVLCSVNLPWCEALAPAFKQATGIDLAFVRLSSAEALARLRAEQANPTFDVWFGGTGDPHYEGFKDAITEFYKPKAYGDLIPELKAAVGTTYIPLYQGVLGIGINPKALQEKGAPIPKCWKDLTNPAYRNFIAMPNPNTSGTAYTFLATVVQLFGEEEAFKYMAQLHRNVAEYTRAGAAPRVNLSRGEVGISIQFVHDLVEFKLQGNPIDVVGPCEGTGYEIGGISLIRKAKNRAEALTFINWALTPEAQAAAVKTGALQVPSNAKTPVAKEIPDPKDYKLIVYDSKKYGNPDIRDPLISRWTKEIFPLPRGR